MRILRPDIHKKLVDGTYTIKNWHMFNSEIALQMMAEEKGISLEEYTDKYIDNPSDEERAANPYLFGTCND
jgi:hypothetical protein|tara:strand:+ start:281 stop:493 length:213 start_codon:yes stop_codon:yes gene_type:complete